MIERKNGALIDWLSFSISSNIFALWYPSTVLVFSSKTVLRPFSAIWVPKRKFLLFKLEQVKNMSPIADSSKGNSLLDVLNNSLYIW